MLGQRLRFIITASAFLAGTMQLFAQSESIIITYKPLAYATTFDLSPESSDRSDMQLEKSLMLGKKCALPVFCAIEHNMEVKSRIPVRIRLGNLDYVNKLEGK